MSHLRSVDQQVDNFVQVQISTENRNSPLIISTISVNLSTPSRAMIAGSIPTLTTPTLTPTTLRNFEQSIIGLDVSPGSTDMDNGPGSFVPPLPSTTSTTTITLQNTWQGGQVSNQYEDDRDEDEPVVSRPVAKAKGRARGGKRTAGGRKPKVDRNISPEEEERRRTRRERNKQAAARCRKRRVDHTNLLVQETEALEATKRKIQEEIQALQSERDELEFLLQAHRHCTKKPRPNTLPVKTAQTPSSELQTPSNGLLSGFDLDWTGLSGNGLTPCVTPGTATAVLQALETPKTEKHN